MTDAEDDRVVEDRPRERTEDLLVFENGTVGWDGVDELVDVDRTAEDGVTLLRVTLFRGRDHTEPLKNGIAQGTQVLARIGGGSYCLPARHTEVCVGFPQAYALVPGIGVVVATLERGSRGGQARVVTKGDGSITLMTTDTNAPGGATVMFRVTPTGFEFVAPWGKLVFDATGFHVLTQAGARMDLGGIYGVPAPLDVLTTYATIKAATIKVEGSTVLLGSDPGGGMYNPVAFVPYNPLLPAPAPQPLGTPAFVPVSNSVRVAA